MVTYAKPSQKSFEQIDETEVNNSTTMSSAGRGWFEGTLDVISGRQTPPPFAPSSPMRPKANGSSSEFDAPEILRLPSQDSVDRSIHNDSGHGHKSSAQIIRDLRQSNARLTARTAALEADFMNQLNETTRQFDERQKKLEDLAREQSTSLKQAELRAKSDKAKLREQEDTLTRLKEESAFHRHTISDLKSQLNGTSSNGSTGGSSVASDSQIRLLQEQNEQLRKEVARLQSTAPSSSASGGDLERTQEALNRTEQALRDLQSKAELSQSQHDKEVMDLAKQLNDKEQDLRNARGGGDGSELLQQKDKQIVELRQKVLEYSQELTAAQAEIARVKEEAQAQETWRQEEADDLRVLNDAQDEEISTLREELKHVLEEMEMAQQELEERDLELEKAKQDMADMEDAHQQTKGESAVNLTASTKDSEDSNSVSENGQDVESLQRRKNELESSVRRLEGEIEDLLQEKVQAAKDMDSLMKEKSELANANSLLKEQLEESKKHNSGSTVSTEGSSSQLKDLEEENSFLSRQLTEHEKEIQMNKEEYEKALAQREVEMEEHVKDLQKAQESLEEQLESMKKDKEDRAREIIRLKQQLRNLTLKGPKNTKPSELSATQSILQDQVAKAHPSADASALKDELYDLQAQKKKEIGELQEKLKDRDTTISALVKSSVTMEQQIAQSQIDIDVLQAKLSKALTSAHHPEEGVDVILAEGEDMSKIKSSLEAYKETETRLSNEVFRLKRQLHHAKIESNRLKSEKNNLASSPSRATPPPPPPLGDRPSTPAATQLKERDDAIARLLKQTMTQEETISDLKRQIEVAKGSKGASKELKQLRQEVEMFAGQVIEQDEEIESLQNQVADKTSLIKDLERECENYQSAAEISKKRSKEIESKLQNEIMDLEDRIATLQVEVDNKTNEQSRANSSVDTDRLSFLEAEVDELREANADKMSELRVLRRQVHESSTSGEELANAKADAFKYQNMADELTAKVEELEAHVDRLKEYKAHAESRSTDEHRIEDLQHEIVERDRIIGELKMDVMSASQSRALSHEQTGAEDEMEIQELKEEIDRLKTNLNSQSSALESARETIRELERMAAEKNEEEHAHFEEEKEELLADIEDLTSQLGEAKSRLEELRNDEFLINEFKFKLEQADEDRELSERAIVENYERKLSLLTLDKDVSIDKLRKDLTSEKEKFAKAKEESDSQISSLEAQLNDFNGKAQEELVLRDTKIAELEQTLGASKQLIDNMRTEMDHLQGSMVNATAGRREEIEDMQQELVDMTATVAKQEREIGALRQQLKDQQVAHESQVAKLQETVELLETQRPEETRRNAQDLAMEIKVKEIKDRLEKLKWRNNTLQEENKTLRDRLEKLGAGESVVQAEKEKIASLQLRMAEQTKRIQNLEAKLEKSKQETAEALQASKTPGASAAPVTPPPVEKGPVKQASRGFFGRKSRGRSQSAIRSSDPSTQ